MALPSSGPLSLNDIQTEFGGTNPIGINEYYAGGSYVPSGTSGTYGAVPSSGAISIKNFYGTSKAVPVYVALNNYNGAGGSDTVAYANSIAGPFTVVTGSSVLNTYVGNSARAALGYSPTLQKFLLVYGQQNNYSDSYFISSPDGVNWTLNMTVPASSITYIGGPARIYEANGYIYYLNSFKVLRITPADYAAGGSWTALTYSGDYTPATNQPLLIRQGGGYFWASSYSTATIAYSSNGSTWYTAYGQAYYPPYEPSGMALSDGFYVSSNGGGALVKVPYTNPASGWSWSLWFTGDPRYLQQTGTTQWACSVTYGDTNYNKTAGTSTWNSYNTSPIIPTTITYQQNLNNQTALFFRSGTGYFYYSKNNLFSSYSTVTVAFANPNIVNVIWNGI